MARTSPGSYGKNLGKRWMRNQSDAIKGFVQACQLVGMSKEQIIEAVKKAFPKEQKGAE